MLALEQVEKHLSAVTSTPRGRSSAPTALDEPGQHLGQLGRQVSQLQAAEEQHLAVTRRLAEWRTDQTAWRAHVDRKLEQRAESSGLTKFRDDMTAWRAEVRAWQQLAIGFAVVGLVGVSGSTLLGLVACFGVFLRR